LHDLASHLIHGILGEFFCFKNHPFAFDKKMPMPILVLFWFSKLAVLERME
jgi:hypothetical protein